MKFDGFKAVFGLMKISKWRKASKCKSLIKQAQLHLVIQKNRRNSIIRQSRGDIAQLLQNGQIQKAIVRVDQLCKDYCLLSAYDQMDKFCECIKINIPQISSGSVKNLSGDVSEAVSSLIFVASRCGELPELNLLRNMFKDCYGHEFVMINVELRQGNFVNSQIKQSLCVNSSVSNDVKLHLISEISREYPLHLGPQYQVEVGTL